MNRGYGRPGISNPWIFHHVEGQRPDSCAVQGQLRGVPETGREERWGDPWVKGSHEVGVPEAQRTWTKRDSVFTRAREHGLPPGQ